MKRARHPRHLPSHRLAALLLVALSLGGTAGAAPKFNTSFLNSAKVYSSPLVTDLLAKIDKAAAAKRWPEVVAHYVELTDQYANQVVQTGPGRFRGVRDVMRERMEQLPPEAVQAFRLQLDGGLGRELRLALERHDILRLKRIGYDMRLSAHSNTALLALLDVAAERGDLPEAYHAGQELQKRLTAAGERSVTLLARLGALAAALGNADALVTMQRDATPAAFSRGGHDVPLTEYLKTLRAAPPTAVGEAQDTVRQFGYNLDNYRTVDATLTIDARPKWGHELLGQNRGDNEKQEASVQRLMGGDEFERSNREFTVCAPHFPVLANNLVYLHSTDRVFCYNTLSGRQQWTWKTAGVSRYIYTDENTVLLSLLYKDLLIVNLETPYREELPMYGTMNYVKPYVPDRFLAAFDRYTGALRWTQARNACHPQVQRCSYPLPPVAYNDRLYVIGTTEVGESTTQCLICLNPDTGACEWQLELCNGLAESNMFGRVLRESVPTPPVIVDDHFIFGTSFGAVISVDLANRDVEWITYYPVTPIPRAQGLELYWRAQRFALNPLLYKDGLVYLAATDSDAVLAFDAATGKPAWEQPRALGDKFLLGFAGEKLIVSGATQTALDAKTGGVEWQTPGVAARLVGRGLITTAGIYVPFLDRLALLDPSNGRIAASQVWPAGRAGGNLCALQGGYTLVCYAANSPNGAGAIHSVMAHFNPAALEQELLAQLKDAPADPLLQYQLGNLYLQSGRVADALPALERGYELALKMPDRYAELAQELRELLFQSCLDSGDRAMLEAKYAAAEQAYQHMAAYAANASGDIQRLLKLSQVYDKQDDAAKRGEMLRQLAQKYPRERIDRAGEPVLAGLYAWQELASLYSRQAPPAYAAMCDAYQAMLQQLGDTMCQGIPTSQYANQQLTILLQRQGAEIYAAFEHKAAALLQTAQPDAYRQALLEYPNSQAAGKTLAAWQRDALGKPPAERNALMETLRRFTRLYPTSEYTLPALIYLVHTDETNRQFASARMLLLRLQRDFGEQPYPGETQRVRDWVEARLEENPNYQVGDHAASHYEINPPLRPQPPAIELATGARLLNIEGEHAFLADSFCLAELGVLRIVRADTRADKLMLLLPIKDQPDSAGLCGDMLIAVCGGTIHGFSLAGVREGARLTPNWSANLHGSFYAARYCDSLILLNQKQQLPGAGWCSVISACYPADGALGWDLRLDAFASQPLLVAGACGLARCKRNAVVFDITSGVTLATFANEGGDDILPAAVLDHRRIALVQNHRDGNDMKSALTVFDAGTGKSMWQTPLPMPFGNTSLLTGNSQWIVISLDRSRQLCAFDTQTGAQLWEWKQEAGAATSPVYFRDLWIENGSLHTIVRKETRDTGGPVSFLLMQVHAMKDGALTQTVELKSVKVNSLDLYDTLHVGNAYVLGTRSFDWNTNTSAYNVLLVSRADRHVLQELEGVGPTGSAVTVFQGGLAAQTKNNVSVYLTADK